MARIVANGGHMRFVSSTRAHTACLPYPLPRTGQARPSPGLGLGPGRAAMSLMGAVAFWLCLNHSKSSGKFNFNVCPPCHASHNYNGRAAAEGVLRCQRAIPT